MGDDLGGIAVQALLAQRVTLWVLDRVDVEVNVELRPAKKYRRKPRVRKTVGLMRAITIARSRRRVITISSHAT
jgi:hypothetical protein